MDSRRTPRTVIDPKVRQVGFFAPPDRTNSGQTEPISSSSTSPPVTEISPSGNSLSPVMIPPPRHSSDSRPIPFAPNPASPLRRESIAAGSSYNPSDFFPPANSPTASSSFAGRVGVGHGEFSDDVVASSSPGRAFRGSSVRASAASSFPSGGFDLTALRASSVPPSELTTVSVKMSPGIAGIHLFSLLTQLIN